MRKELLAKLEKARGVILENKKIGVAKLERLSAEIKNEFNSAIETLAEKRDLIKEMEFNRESLRRFRIGVFKTIWPVNFKYLFSMPFIYGMFFPALFLHLCLEIYHQVCFRIYGIPRVLAGEYFIYDRQLLPYLNWLEKFNCLYCSYVNNLFRYAVEIGGRTERYWCPIKYHRRINGAHSQYPKFVDYLDAENFRQRWKGLRDFSDLAPETGGDKKIQGGREEGN